MRHGDEGSERAAQGVRHDVSRILIGDYLAPSPLEVVPPA